MNLTDLNDDCLILILKNLELNKLEDIILLKSHLSFLCCDNIIWENILKKYYNLNSNDLINMLKEKDNNHELLIPKYYNNICTQLYDIFKYIHPNIYLVIDVVKGNYNGAKYIIKKEKTTIGRSRKNNISFLADESVSRFHLCIEYYEDSYWIIDTCSTNGTFKNIYNTKNIALPYNISHRIKHNYNYSLGNTEIICKYVY